VGGRDGLTEALAAAELNPKQEHLLRLLEDPARAGDSLQVLCKAAGIRANELLELYRKASFARAHAVAIGRAADAIPAVVNDLAAKSVDREVDCKLCRGTGDIGTEDNEKRCPECGGSGKTVIESDLSRQKTLLDMLGLGKKAASGTKIINTNAQLNAGGAGSLFSSFVRSTDADAYDTGSAPIDAEITPAEGE
jgi:hypothetical protein